jgi:2-polyprenyl-6-hydroxyphenyl methylase/3-demethylubiquinone-9 3-methyltransferase
VVGQVLEGKNLKRFDFGSNWQAFSDRLIDAQRLAVAVRSLRSLLQKDTLNGASFLDVGCGSGLFSIAAHQLGASRVTGIDINPRCIAVAKQNRDRLIAGAPIIFQEASALCPQGLEKLGLFDVVYAWGALHHTGAMWDAIGNVAARVNTDGTFVVAIYNKHFTSSLWKAIKWLYNQLPKVAQRFMIILFTAIIYVAKFLVTWRNPLNKDRGMDFRVDVIDWVGGFPYEYATPDEVEKFVCNQGFFLRRYVAAQVPTGCNEFVFIKSPLPQVKNGGCDGSPGTIVPSL